MRANGRRPKLNLAFYPAIAALAAFGLSSCVGPLVSFESARTVGRGQLEVLAGFGQSGYVYKANYGINSNLDLGVQGESLSFGYRAKYAILNQREAGWSTGVALGGNYRGHGGPAHYYVDAMVSWLRHQIEPYGTLRYAHVRDDLESMQERYTGDVQYSIRSDHFDYGQAILGGRAWLGKHAFFGVEVSLPFTMTNHLFMSQALLFGSALGYHF